MSFAKSWPHLAHYPGFQLAIKNIQSSFENHINYNNSLQNQYCFISKLILEFKRHFPKDILLGIH